MSVEEDVDQINEKDLSNSGSLMTNTGGSGRPILNDIIDEVLKHYYNEIMKITENNKVSSTHSTEKTEKHKVFLFFRGNAALQGLVGWLGLGRHCDRKKQKKQK